MKILRVVACFATCSALLAASVAKAEERECYDAVVYARAVKQVSAGMPSCDDCVVMRWPYFVDLRVKRVVEGDVHKGPLTVLALQHGQYKSKAWNWWLRRNTAGGFNVVARVDGDALERCAADAPAAKPFLKPGNGQTLQDVRDKLDKRPAE